MYSQDRMDLPIIEDFEKDTAWIWFPWMQVARSNSAVNKGCAHSGKFGLNCINDYVIRNDLQIGFPEQVISCWVRFQRSTNAYLGFGRSNDRETDLGYFLVLSPENNSLDFRRSPDYTYPILKSVSQTYKMNSWYRLELTFTTNTKLTGKLYASDGKTLLNTIAIELPDLTPGGISFRGHYLHVDDFRGGTIQEVTEAQFAPKIGTPFILHHIVFESNKSNLLEQSYVELNKLVLYLKRYPELTIKIVGHTDAIGNEDDNRNLSEARANAVAEYLLKKGINKANINHIGLGSSKPVATNSTEEGRQLNRRVEIILTAN